MADRRKRKPQLSPVDFHFANVLFLLKGARRPKTESGYRNTGIHIVKKIFAQGIKG